MGVSMSSRMFFSLGAWNSALMWGTALCNHALYLSISSLKVVVLEVNLSIIASSLGIKSFRLITLSLLSLMYDARSSSRAFWSAWRLLSSRCRLLISRARATFWNE